MDLTPTAHNNAKKGEIAKTVLMPGDPLRAKYIAETFLTAPKLVNDVRNMCCYTGTYEGKPVSVMGSGMGTSSIGIYSYELYNFYDVDSIIRVGSAGGMQSYVKLRDIIIAVAAATDSNYAHIYNLPGTPAFCADFGLVERAVKYAREHDLPFHVGPILSGELFYGCGDETKRWADFGLLAKEMESSALFANASAAGKKALTVCTISDIIFGEAAVDLTPEERQTGFDDMIKLSLSLI